MLHLALAGSKELWSELGEFEKFQEVDQPCGTYTKGIVETTHITAGRYELDGPCYRPGTVSTPCIDPIVVHLFQLEGITAMEEGGLIPT